MRPTDLSFRSPKESTPASYDVRMSFDGRKLSYTAPGGKFSRDRRFSQYDIEAKKNSFRVGPGSYHLSSKRSDRFMLKYQPLVRKNDSKNGYVMIGNHMLLDDEFNSFTVKSPVKGIFKSLHKRKQSITYKKNTTKQSPYYSTVRVKSNNLI